VRGTEDCDDGNRASGDGCNFECMLERGWRCQLGQSCAGNFFFFLGTGQPCPGNFFSNFGVEITRVNFCFVVQGRITWVNFF
jgi:cysteine-rich repeat protein